jgi:uncharacterized membrane protein YczE
VTQVLARAARIVAGLFLVAVGFALLYRAHLGMGPWFAVNQGIAAHLAISEGAAAIVMGFTFFVLALLLRERPGLGTLATVTLGGVFIDVVLPRVPTPHGIPLRLLVVVVALLVVTFGGALAISAGWGASPYDSFHIAVFRHTGGSYTAIRLALEALGLVLGWVLGGEIGVGLVIVAIAVGPCLRFWMGLLGAMPLKHGEARSSA